MWVLDLEPPNVVLKKEGDGAIIYSSPGMITSRCQVQNGNTPECAPARDWPSFSSDVLIGGYDSSRRLWYCSLILSSKYISSRSSPRAMARITMQWVSLQICLNLWAAKTDGSLQLLTLKKSNIVCLNPGTSLSWGHWFIQFLSSSKPISIVSFMSGALSRSSAISAASVDCVSRSRPIFT